MKEKLIKDIILAMSNRLTPEQSQELEMIFFLKMKDYEVTEIVTDLTIRDDSNFTILGRYIATISQRGYSKGTISLYKSRILNLLMYINKPLVEITADDLRTYLSYYKATRKVSNRTLDGVRKNIRSFWIWLQKEDFILKNAAIKLDKIKYPTIMKKPYTNEEMAKIHDACRDERDLALTEVLYSTGVRVSELVSLNREDVINGEATVMGKGSRERKVYFSKKAMYYLNKYLDTRSDSNPALFVTKDKNHKRFQKGGIEARVKKIGMWAGVEKVHPHRWRHSIASSMISQGAPVQEVQKILGHATISTTMSFYATVNQDDVKATHIRLIP